MIFQTGDRDALFRELLENRPRFPEVEEALPVPGYTAWALWRSAARFLGNLAVATKRRNILEFGSGSSSRVLAAALARNGGGRLTALENLPGYSEETWAAIEAVQGVDALLVPTPLKLVADRHGIRYRYAVAEAVLGSRGPFDLVFIDGPPFFCGREGTLPDVVKCLAPGALIVMDDARRAAERRTLARWNESFPGLRVACVEPDFGGEVGHGIAVLEFDGNDRRVDGIRLSLGATLDWLRTFRHIRWKWRFLAGKAGS